MSSPIIRIPVDPSAIQQALNQLEQAVKTKLASVQGASASAASSLSGNLFIPQAPTGLQSGAGTAAYLGSIEAALRKQFSQAGLKMGQLGLGTSGDLRRLIQGSFGGITGGPLSAADTALSRQIRENLLKSQSGLLVPSNFNAATAGAVRGVQPGRGRANFYGDPAFDVQEAAFSKIGAKQERAAIAAYIASKKELTVAQNEATAAIKRQATIDAANQQALIATDQDYIAAKKSLAVTSAQQAAILQSQLSVDKEYQAARQQLAVSTARQAAIQQAALSTDQEYLKSKAGLAIGQQRERAAIANRLADDPRYIKAKSDAASASAVEAANIRERLASDFRYLAAKQEVARYSAIEAAEIKTRLASDLAYTRAKADGAVAQARINATVSSQLAVDATYLDAKAQAAVAQARESAAIQGRLAVDPAYIQAKVDATLAQQAQAIAIKQSLVADGTYAQQQAQLASLKAQETIQLNTLLTTTQASVVAEQVMAEAMVQRAANLKTAILTGTAPAGVDPGGLAGAAARQANLEGRIGAQRINADEAAENLGSREYIQQKTRATANTALLNAQLEAELATHPAYIAAQQLATRTKLAEAQSVTALDLQMQGQLAAQTKINALIAKEAEIRALSTDQALRLKAQEILLQREYNAALQQSVAAELRNQGRPFAATLARFGAGGYSVGQGGQTGVSGFFGGGLLSTLKYSLPSLALFAGIAGISGAVKDAEELRKTFSQLEAQLESVGRGDQFEGLRENILQIATDTGASAETIAKFAVTLQGAFGQNSVINGRSGQDLVEFQTKELTKLDRLLGLEDKQVLDATLALGTNFNVDAAQISNIAFQTLQNTGVAAEETLTFLADIAPAAEEAGFSLEQMAAFGAIAIQSSGKSASTISEQLGRVIPAISKAKTDLVQIAAGNPLLNTDEFLSAVGSGDVFTQLQVIGRNFDQLDKNAQNSLVNLLGGRREAATILSILKQFDKVEGLAGKLDVNNAEAANRAYEKLQATLGQTAAELGQVLKELAISLLDSGLADALKVILESLKGITTVLSNVVGLLGQVNSSLGGVPALGVAAFAAARYVPGINSLGGAKPGVASPGVYGPPLPGTVGGAPSVLPSGVNSAIGPFAGLAAIVGLSTAVSTYQDQKSQAENAARSFAEQIKTANQETVDQLMQDQDDLVNTVANAIFGNDSVAEIAIKEDARRKGAGSSSVIDQIVASQNTQIKSKLEDELGSTIYQDIVLARGNDTGLSDGAFTLVRDLVQSGDFSFDALVDLKNKADKGNKDAVAAINFVIKTLPQNNPALRSLLEAAIDGNAETGKAAEQVSSATVDLASLQTEVDYGVIGSAEAQNRALSALETSRQAAAGGNSPELMAEYLKLRQDTQKSIVEWIRGDQEFADLLAGVGSTDSESIQRDLGNVIDILSNSNITDRQIRFDALSEAIDLERQLFEDGFEELETGAEKIAYLNSGAADLDPAVLTALVSESLKRNQDIWTKHLDLYVRVFDENYRAVFEATIANALTGKASVDEAIAALSEFGLATALDGNIQLTTDIQEILDKYRALVQTGLEPIEALRQAFGVDIPNASFDTTKKMKEAQEQAQKEAEEAAEEAKKRAEEERKAAIDLRNAQFEYYKILAGGDSVRVADISLDQAYFQLSNAQNPVEEQEARNAIAQAERDRRDADRAIEDSRSKLNAAGAQGNELRLAEIAKEDARRALERAEGDAQKFDALAQAIAADRQFIDAVRNLYDAQADLATSIAEAAGDGVEVARISVVEARRKLAEAQADLAAGFGDQGDVDQAQAALNRSVASERDANLQRRLGDLSFLYDMEKISKSQYIQYLQALKQLPDLTQDQLRDIDRQIKQLSSELQQDLQFNLPTNLALPTLYEGRRSLSGTYGGGYQDNRNIVIQLNVTNEADRAKVTQIINDALGQPRSGTVSRRY